MGCTPAKNDDNRKLARKPTLSDDSFTSKFKLGEKIKASIVFKSIKL